MSNDTDITLLDRHNCTTCHGIGQQISITKGISNCLRCNGKGYHNLADRRNNWMKDNFIGKKTLKLPN